jgi:predicted NBD/HSP70 family sugar kinase
LHDLDRLHQDISNRQRIRLILGTALADVISAPGHRQLRHPDLIADMSRALRCDDERSLRRERILLNVFTDTSSDGSVSLRSVECIDGHHRLVAGLGCGMWRTVADLPPDILDVLVNGWRAHAQGPEPRWIPLEVAERSALPRDRWIVVPPNWGPKGPTAQVPGDISSLDPIFAVADRGVPLRELAASLSSAAEGRTLCVDIGGTRIKWAVLRTPLTLDQLQGATVETMRSLGWLNAGLADLLGSESHSGISAAQSHLPHCEAVCVAICSKIEESGELGGQLVQRFGVPKDLAARMEQTCHKPVRLFNDGVSWAAGALHHARLAGADVALPALAITLGTGVGIAMILGDGAIRPYEMAAPLRGQRMAEAAGWEALRHPWDVHQILGRPFFDWVAAARSHWSYTTVRRQFSARVAALILDLEAEVSPPATVIVGGGNAEYVSVRELGSKTGLAILPCRRPELQIDPDLISLIGCLSLQERARPP